MKELQNGKKEDKQAVDVHHIDGMVSFELNVRKLLLIKLIKSN
jgi:hypothetical protein